MDKAQISLETLSNVLRFLHSCPYAQVHKLIEEINKNAVILQDVPSKVVEEK